jgi:bacterioferritin (cytochrome b1)
VFAHLLTNALIAALPRTDRGRFLAGCERVEHSNEEQGHGNQIAERILQLSGAPDFAPDRLVMRSPRSMSKAIRS